VNGEEVTKYPYAQAALPRFWHEDGVADGMDGRFWGSCAFLLVGSRKPPDAVRKVVPLSMSQNRGQSSGYKAMPDVSAGYGSVN
jgi:hypothetical protein